VDLVLQSHQTLCFVFCNVVQAHCSVHAQSHNEASACLVGAGRVRVNVAPLEVENGSFLLVQAHDVVLRFGRPYQDLGVFIGLRSEEVTFLVPFDAENLVFVSLPNLLWYLGHVDRPQIDFLPTRRRQLSVVLPSDVDNLTGLLKSVLNFLFDRKRLPNLDIGVFTA